MRALRHVEHVARDRHREVIFVGERHHRRGALHPFGDHVHPRDDIVDMPPLAEFDADVAVARQRAGAGRDQVAHAGEPREGFGPPAHRDAEPRDLGQSARHQGRARVVARAEPVAHADRDRDDILEHPAELAAEQVGVGIDAEQPRVEHRLKRADDDLVLHRQDAGGRLPGHDLAREVGAGEDADRVAGQDVLDQLGHPLARGEFEPLGQADHRHPGAEVIARFL